MKKLTVDEILDLIIATRKKIESTEDKKEKDMLIKEEHILWVILGEEIGCDLSDVSHPERMHIRRR